MEVVWDFVDAVRAGRSADALDHVDVDRLARFFTERGIPYDGTVFESADRLVVLLNHDLTEAASGGRFPRGWPTSTEDYPRPRESEMDGNSCILVLQNGGFIYLERIDNQWKIIGWD